ncbi:MAG: peptide chain release factor 1 [Proteobacteria bacterium]|nr:peptide chain release factor 1 [Pseudomonadota bacterium]MCP4918946.1 peptide chain release factor 1 [Pseudomonadota bacterium]
MFDRLEVMEARHGELERMLMDPAITGNRNRMRDVSKEHSQVTPIVTAYREHRQLTAELVDVEEMLSDPDMREMAQEEKATITARLKVLEDELRVLLLPKDPYEGRNILLEIRAGTGGDEAALFASDLFRMYARYGDSNKLRLEVLSTSEISVGGGGGKTSTGFKEVVALVTGDGAYSRLKFESGVHRVQRVPLTETQGRIHTSAATVAILPEPEEVEVNLQESDVRVDVFRASGPGGQSVNTTDSAVRLFHKPTGLTVICQDEKSQHKNKAKAMKVLKARMFELEESARHAEEAEQRKSMVGTGDRSERIRTYNYPQNRVTDHRINLTVYKLDRIVGGDLDELVTPLTAHHQAKLIEDQDDR